MKSRQTSLYTLGPTLDTHSPPLPPTHQKSGHFAFRRHRRRFFFSILLGRPFPSFCPSSPNIASDRFCTGVVNSCVATQTPPSPPSLSSLPLPLPPSLFLPLSLPLSRSICLSTQYLFLGLFSSPPVVGQWVPLLPLPGSTIPPSGFIHHRLRHYQEFVFVGCFGGS